MRNVFSEEITRLAEADPRVALLSGDIGNRLFDTFKERCPGRFFNCGIAEGNMMGVAAGMALDGLRPVVYTIAPFTTTRCLEQIKLDVCYHNVPVVIAGTGAGLSYAELGATHHSCEDLAILRVLPGMTVFCPCDPVELRLGMAAALEAPGPLYLRLGKKGEPALHAVPPEGFALGKAITLREGRDLCLIATGTIMSEALRAAERLAEAGMSARVESFHTVKPLDEARLADLFAAYELVAVLEEHSRIGGLGGAVAEWAAAARPRPRARLMAFGADDAFLHKIASQQHARHLFGLTGEAVAARLRAALSGS